MGLILLVDDEKSMREFLTIMLENDGHETKAASNGEDAVKLIQENAFDLVITDIRMRRSNGLEVLEAAREINPNIPVVMMTAYASAETAVEAMKKGAYDYISKPFKVEDLQLIVKNAIEKKKLSDENLYLKSELKHIYDGSNIIGKSPAIAKVFSLINKVSSSNATVLLDGESGTGKELVARAIHYSGTRKNYPFVSVNCGAMPEGLLESELFGHEKGAFTSADTVKVGLMETAQKGSFFLDEVGEAPMAIQVKLLRVLQEREFTRVGGTKAIHVDLRFIAASNIDLAEAIKNKVFREDLFYRLNVIPIHMPTLRDRVEDIPALVDFFLKKYNDEHQSKAPIEGIRSEAMMALERYRWPGNVRELQNVIERAVVLETGNLIHISSLPDEIVGQSRASHDMSPQGKAFSVDLEEALGQIEKKMIVDALNRKGGKVQAAAKLLELNERSMRYRLQKHGIKTGEIPEMVHIEYQKEASDSPSSELEKTLDHVEKKMILEALQNADGIISRAAELLNLSLRSLGYRLQKHNIQRKFFLKE